jgi:hypothetical protein
MESSGGSRTRSDDYENCMKPINPASLSKARLNNWPELVTTKK